MACNSSERSEPVAPAAVQPAAEHEPKAKKVEPPTPLLLEPLAAEPPPGDINVVLPPAPLLEHAAVPTKDADGHWSIDGLRRDRTTQLAAGQAGTEITVKGWVQQIYLPPECPAGTVCPPNKQPHFWITDTPHTEGRKRAMMVVNYAFTIPEWEAERWKDEPEVVLHKGTQYVFKGHFKQFSDTGFSHQAGLLEFVAVLAVDARSGTSKWIYPRASPWHPVQVALREADKAELIEAAP